MKKLWYSVLFISFVTLAVACGESEPENTGPTNVNDINLDPLEAELMIPESADPGEELILEVVVTQGEEIVDDASEVIFEVWMDGEKSDSEMIEADLPGVDGMYAVSYLFQEEAHYKVQPHVTARGSHVMPVGDILIGDVQMDEENNEAHHNDHEHSHEEHLHESLTLEWNTTETASVDDNVTVSINVEWEDEAWVDGDVQFEIWKHGDEMHEWIDGEEINDGQYEAIHSFKDEGDYHIIVHMEDEDIHEHVQYSLTIE
ncbi:FixH family protein [Salipaludibacillus daqingensis]|uniref:FixH family protein n=1 Tax=Salipaludibacillus daqingensis TaxID=3041001 RepID=UPI002474D116|nr:FixH family protein [Salipaludibacillus daqingensis]